VDELLAFWSLEDYETTLEELEEALITADFGPKTALKIVDKLRLAIKSGKVKTSLDLKLQLKVSIIELLNARGKSSELRLEGEPAVVFIVGVNGAGKTTTIGKLASKFGNEGAKVYLIPGDTFRAAAAEQLAEWGRRSNAMMGSFSEGSKPTQVISNCLHEAKQRKADLAIDIVICDTAGRLHTAYALMEELQACKEAIGAALPGQPAETLLVLDGTTGLNMLNQAREFNESVKLSGLILTKLDGTARGGAVVSVVDQLGVPVKFIGVGETADDLQPFSAEAFAEALFPSSPSQP
jgi:fused signal recognition particle receptor